MNNLAMERNVFPSFFGLEPVRFLQIDTALEKGTDAECLQISDMLSAFDVSSLLDDFCTMTGVAASVVDLHGNVLVSSHWQRICKDFHRINSVTRMACLESDACSAVELKVGEVSRCLCRNGISELVSPVFVDGRYLLNVFFGQFLLASADNEFFVRQIERAGFDHRSYLQALDEVPVISEDKLTVISKALLSFTSLLSTMGEQQLRVKRTHAELISQQQKLEQLVEQRTSELLLQNRILEQIGSEISLHGMLDMLTKQVESLHPGMRCSILLLDERGHLRIGAAPSLPSFYNRAIDGLVVGDGVGSCGTAVARRECIVVEDIRIHPYWLDFRSLAGRAKLQSCWSYPVIASDGQVLGTFAIYHAKPSKPSSAELILIKRYANLARLIIERKHEDEVLRDSEEMYRFLTENAMEVIWAFDPESWRFIYVSPSVFKLSGYTPEEVMGQSVGLLLSKEDGLSAKARITKRVSALRSGMATVDKFYFDEVEQCCKDGSRVWTEVITNFYINEKSKRIEMRGVTRDISERKKIEEIIHNLAFHDALTQLPNRRMLDERLKQVFAISKRSGRYGALMFIDLDNFKPLNDQKGHTVGDLLLVEAARRLTASIREIDTVARFGGDEFVVLLAELDEDQVEAKKQANAIAEKILSKLAEPYRLNCPDVVGPDVVGPENIIEHHCTASIGVVMFINHDKSIDDVIKFADMAMYKAKEIGRNSVCFYNVEG